MWTAGTGTVTVCNQPECERSINVFVLVGVKSNKMKPAILKKRVLKLLEEERRVEQQRRLSQFGNPVAILDDVQMQVLDIVLSSKYA